MPLQSSLAAQARALFAEAKACYALLLEQKQYLFYVDGPSPKTPREDLGLDSISEDSSFRRAVFSLQRIEGRVETIENLLVDHEFGQEVPPFMAASWCLGSARRRIANALQTIITWPSPDARKLIKGDTDLVRTAVDAALADIKNARDLLGRMGDRADIKPDEIVKLFPSLDQPFSAQYPYTMSAPSEAPTVTRTSLTDIKSFCKLIGRSDNYIYCLKSKQKSNDKQSELRPDFPVPIDGIKYRIGDLADYVASCKGTSKVVAKMAELFQENPPKASDDL